VNPSKAAIQEIINTPEATSHHVNLSDMKIYSSRMEKPQKGYQEQVANLCPFGQAICRLICERRSSWKITHQQTQSQTEVASSASTEGNQKPKDRRPSCKWL